MGQMKFENLVIARDLYNNLIADFPDDYKSLIDNAIKDKKDKDVEDSLKQLSGTFLLNSYLNEKHLFLEEEMNYLMEVRGYIIEKISELRNKQNLEFLKKKGKLTPEQLDKYSTKLPKVDKDKIDGRTMPELYRSQIKPDYIERSKTFDTGIVIGVVIGVLVTSVFVVTLGLFGLL